MPTTHYALVGILEVSCLPGWMTFQEAQAAVSFPTPLLARGSSVHQDWEDPTAPRGWAERNDMGVKDAVTLAPAAAYV
ncbi:hypothetical protein [Candidatus Methylacidithermus pantelleriae]|uniref:Uncharacterized protein n=1 Tax=Candidatus Methylacidithermus pantelleriae TaxID=2744239 RepID=A0A8J2FX68_9BACT|nr:hypothetical protein [Candidatus Methylacidithermus pantelleriae]CAF0703555.1 hypothetical protein MPNT_60030 [Candidatus Methylacidithermus pantelleriae]